MLTKSLFNGRLNRSLTPLWYSETVYIAALVVVRNSALEKYSYLKSSNFDSLITNSYRNVYKGLRFNKILRSAQKYKLYTNTRLDEATKPIVSSVLAADVILCTM